MIDSLAATVVLLLHLAFIVFVVLGGLLAWRDRRLALLHLPAAAWGCWVELSGAICPLTRLENLLRRRAGQTGYSGGFIEHYLLALIYPHGLTRPVQFALAALVLGCNALVYAPLLLRLRRGRR